ncbi:rCG46000 [Rattus norvegicus]|uniref:RCG46000 n=1 Tax=Rattus norvegicus TaxID=10116 RepID=A6ICL8_RAT|nr:rCG46000 [Rattus norvegicus]
MAPVKLACAGCVVVRWNSLMFASVQTSKITAQKLRSCNGCC